MKTLTQEIDEILGPVADGEDARQERTQQVNKMVLLIAEQRTRALREAADGVTGGVDFLPLLGKKGWQIHEKLTSMVARYLQDRADKQLGISNCRWCGSTEHTSRAHDDAQF